VTKLDLINLTKIYTPSGAGVFGLNLTVEPGELMVLLGPSGSGKTTTLRLVAGLAQPSSGDLHFDGSSVVAVPPEQRGAVMVFQQDALFPFMSVGDNVAYGLRLRRLPRGELRRRVEEALVTVQLSGYAARWPDQLSGGQRQRVALARVLAITPKVLLLDEPLSSLDPELRGELAAMIRTIQRDAGITTILVTHDQQEALGMGDRIALLVDGRLHQVGAPRSFFESPRDLKVARFFGGANFWPGRKEGVVVHTEAGPLAVAPSAVPDGQVIVAVRPEAIQVGATGDNNLVGVVRTFDFHGASARCTALVNGVELEVAVRPYEAYAQGQAITLHIPRERISLFPAENSHANGHERRA
jgi:ABC-type Fe3+/spermidine/putrescine transport system ATPase subunit